MNVPSLVHVWRLPAYYVAGFRPGSRATFDSAKVAKTMLAVMWPFGFPVRFADSGGAQTRYAQILRAFSSVSDALLVHTTRSGTTRFQELCEQGYFNLRHAGMMAEVGERCEPGETD